MKKRIVFTGGGTVGHVTLNLILIPKFIEDGWEVHYIGDKHGIEYKQIAASNFAVHFHAIKTGKLRRYFSWQNVWDVFKVNIGIIQSLTIIAKIRPQLVFSKGGFVAVPPVVAARLLGVPVFIHESDLSMGLANRIASKFATLIYTTFEQHGSSEKIKPVGAITKINKMEPKTAIVDRLKTIFDDNLKTILFIGGSAGARVFNDFVTHTPELTQKYNIINISGDKSLNQFSQHLYRIDYVTDDYQSLLGLADIVVTRGGSNTIFELLALKKLQVIVPLGREASRGDQLENAAYFEQKGYAKTLLEKDLTFQNLEAVMSEMFETQIAYEKVMSTTEEINTPENFYQLLTEDIKKIKGI